MATTKQDLMQFLKFLSNHIDREITLIAVGGTALTLLGIKESTKDIDFDLPESSDCKIIEGILKDLNFEKKGFSWFATTNIGITRIDLFKGGYIFNIQLLDDYINKTRIITKIGNITLKTISLQDIIITKIGRGDERDFDDIKQIYEKERIDNDELIERYFKAAESLPDAFSEVVRMRLLDLIEIKFKQWGKEDARLVEKVKKWKI